MSDLEEKSLDDLTVTGGWRLLCVGLMADATARIKESRNLFRQARGLDHYSDKSFGMCQRDAWTAAERWIQGGVGTVTFEDACAVLEVAPEIARKKIEEYAYARRRDRPSPCPW